MAKYWLCCVLVFYMNNSAEMSDSYFNRPLEEVVEELLKETFLEDLGGDLNMVLNAKTQNEMPVIAHSDWLQDGSCQPDQPRLASTRKYLESSQVDRDQRCPVCVDGLMGKHKYYGGRVCHSCRGFFRRSVQTGYYLAFQCLDEQDCIITSKGRKSCRWCRFHKCIETGGLQTTMVMSPDQRRDRMIKRNTRLIRRQGRLLKKEILHRNAVATTFSLQDLDYFRTLFFELLGHNHKKHYDVFASNPAELTEFFDSAFKGRGFKVSLLSSLYSIDEFTMKNFSFDLPDMLELTPSDRMTLISNNYPMAVGLEWAWFLSSQDIPMYFQDFLEYRNKNPTMCEPLASTLRDCLRSPSVFDYWSIPNLYHASRVRDEFEAVWYQLGPRLRREPGAPSDLIFNILLVMIMLFSPVVRSGMLEDPHKVEAIQGKFVKILDTYLRMEYPDTARDWLTRSVSMRQAARQFYELHWQLIRDS